MVSLLRRTQYGAYNMAKQTASKTRQIVMLYDGVIRFVQQARQAIEDKRFEDRYKLLTKASEVVIGLQSSLDFDHGADIAQQLYDFYTEIDRQLMAIHRTNSVEACDEIVDLLKTMRAEWHRIDVLEENKSTVTAQSGTISTSEDEEEEETDAIRKTGADTGVASTSSGAGVQISV